jgi:sulfopyruvate decarboxylase subunit beta
MYQIVDECVITNIGNISKAVYAIRDRGRNFYMTGSMGLCTSIGLGLAKSSCFKIVCIEGDGSLFMNFNTLLTLVTYQPNNLCIFLLDNKLYETTGSQKSYDPNQVKLNHVLSSLFGGNYYFFTKEKELEVFLKDHYHRGGFQFVHICVDANEEKYPLIPLDCRSISKRFLNSLR